QRRRSSRRLSLPHPLPSQARRALRTRGATSAAGIARTRDPLPHPARRVAARAADPPATLRHGRPRGATLTGALPRDTRLDGPDLPRWLREDRADRERVVGSAG